MTSEPGLSSCGIQLPVYFGLTFAISWGGAAVAIAGGGGISWPVVVDPRFAYAVVAMLAGPSISGVC